MVLLTEKQLIFSVDVRTVQEKGQVNRKKTKGAQADFVRRGITMLSKGRWWNAYYILREHETELQQRQCFTPHLVGQSEGSRHSLSSACPHAVWGSSRYDLHRGQWGTIVCEAVTPKMERTP